VNTGSILLWLTRGAWVLVALVGSRAIDDAVDGRTTLAAWTIAVACWVAWAIVAAAIAIPAVWTLTIARVVAPVAIVATVASGFAGAPAASVLLLGVPAVLTVATLFSAEVGQVFAQASAYGDEERFVLRVPAAAGVAALVSWIVWAAAVVAAVVSVAAGNWLLAVPCGLLAIGLSWLLFPRWHRLSRRWLVLVPAGLVVHDPVVLADTMMLRRQQIGAVGLARTGTGAADLTGPASGHAVEVATTESVTVVYAPTPSERAGKAIHLSAFLVAPSRPGRALAAAARRSLPLR
jgi:hypothetical protein